MSGQFGMGKSDTGPSNVTSSGTSGGDASPAISALKLSEAPLDAQLRKSLDSLPRRVNDQFKNLGDMVNFVIVGSQKDVQAALDAADAHEHAIFVRTKTGFRLRNGRTDCYGGQPSPFPHLESPV